MTTTAPSPIRSSFGLVTNLIKPKKSNRWEFQKRIPKSIQYNLDVENFKSVFRQHCEILHRESQPKGLRIMIIRKTKSGYRMIGQGREVGGKISEVKREAKRLGYTHVKFLQHVISVG